MNRMTVPASLASNCRKTDERQAWLAQLPDAIRELEIRWSITVENAFDTEDVSCAWVAPAKLASGASVIFKLGMPHMEGAHEIAGLRFWSGDPTVHLLEADENLGAMLLERCEPGTALRSLPEPEQDIAIAALLRRLWRTPPMPHRFRHLSELMAYWADETLADADKWPDAGLTREGLSLFTDLSKSTPTDVLIATDLHAGNVLRAQREPWLVIDPKPFVGDSAYDATQHLFNCMDRLCTNPADTIDRFADLLDLDPQRVRLWTFARAAADPRDDWNKSNWFRLARTLAP